MAAQGYALRVPVNGTSGIVDLKSYLDANGGDNFQRKPVAMQDYKVLGRSRRLSGEYSNAESESHRFLRLHISQDMCQDQDYHHHENEQVEGGGHEDLPQSLTKGV